MKKKIAVDFDDVVFDFNGYFVPWHNKHFGTKVVYENITSFTLQDVYGSDAETMLGRVRQFTHEQHRVVQPVAGAIEALRRLSTRYELHIVTSRSETTSALVKEWEATHGPSIFSKHHFTNGYGGLDHHTKRTKSSVCKDVGVVVHIEDAPSHAYEVAQSGIPVLMPDRPWNRNMSLPQNVIRVHSWDTIEHWMYAHH